MLSVSETLISLADLSNMDAVLGKVLSTALEVTDMKVGGILLFDTDTQMYRYRVHQGLSREYVDGMEMAPDRGIVGAAVRTGKSVLVPNLSGELRAERPELIAREGLRSLASIPLASETVLGTLNVASHEERTFSGEDVRLLESIGAQIAAAIEKATLQEELRRKDEARGELLEDMFTIQEEERRRIARELHDETSQVLASLNAGLEAAVSVLPPDGADQARSLLQRSQALAVSILDEIHRLIYELRPTLLDDMGLVAATRWLLEQHLKPAGIEVIFKTIGRERRLPLKLEVTLFRVVQEAASNIQRHAGASRVSLMVRFKKDSIRIQISDDGRGFDVEEAITAKDRPRGLGLLGMKERIELMDGTIAIRSRPRDGGTKIDIEVPLTEEAPNG